MDEQIEAVEAGYEYLLAYAAQGKDRDAAEGQTSEVRQTLEKMAEAAVRLQADLKGSSEPFHAVIVEDAAKSHAAISLVLAQQGISSEIVDNLNASMHLRALLTDLFLLSEAAS